jgi:hypothetical protein
MHLLLALLLSLILLIDCGPLAVWAATVNFTPAGTAGAGTMDGEVPVNKVGKLLMSDGVAIFKGTTVDIMGTPAGGTQKQNLLSGVCFKTESTAGSKPQLKGHCYFRQGPGLATIDDPSAEELIDLVDGGVVSGHIVAINTEEVEIEEHGGNRRRIAMSGVRGIKSPRVYTFVAPCVVPTAVAVGTAFTGECTRMSFNPTWTGKVAATPHVKPQQPQQSTVTQTAPPSDPGTGGIHSGVGKVVVGGLVLCGIACAIALPIAIPLATRGNRNRRRQQEALHQFAAVDILTRQRVPPPAPTPVISSE